MKRERLKTRIISLAVALLAAVMMVADLRANSLPISFTYDGLGRLETAAYSEPGGRPSSSRVSGTPSYSTTYAYGADSRPLTVRRQGVRMFLSHPTDLIPVYGEVDNLEFSYSGSRLTKVDDSAASVIYSGASDFNDGADAATEYTYDSDGRLTSDANKGITSIRYNAIGLPAVVTFADGSSITNRYGADGSLLQRVKAEPIKSIVLAAAATPVIRPTTTTVSDNHIGPLTIRKTSAKANAATTALARIDTPSGYIADGRMHYYVKDYQGNVRQVTDADGKVEQDNHYYPYGMLMAESSDILASASGAATTGNSLNPYLYGGKEYLTTGSANLLDFTARTYDPTTLLFHTQDPFNYKFTRVNSYSYCAADPINYIDPDGRAINILGTDTDGALSQLQKKVGSSITLKLNENGSLTYEVSNPSEQLKGAAQRMANMIDDNFITVDFHTKKGHITSVGLDFTGGAFMGNEVEIMSDGTVKVVAHQEVNPGVLTPMSDATGDPGADMFHELTEAYEGALISQAAKKSSPRAGVEGSVYEEAHNKASPQSGQVFYRFLDKDGNEMPKIGKYDLFFHKQKEYYVVGKDGQHVVIKKTPRTFHLNINLKPLGPIRK